jgi:hypothetical protein
MVGLIGLPRLSNSKGDYFSALVYMVRVNYPAPELRGIKNQKLTVLDADI